MNRSHVTLPQILVAASTRHATMVPESAGYFVLALCEAIGCLPLAVPDSAIELSADGAVGVTQQGKVVSGPEASQAMRDLFSRLLAVTTGPTPRLAAVARAREVSAERGVDTFAAEIEAALVPMNRAAGKRSLGRLARETLRAIESGTLALHLQVRAAVKEAPVAVKEAVAPLFVLPSPVVKPTFTPPERIVPRDPITPPPSMLGERSESNPFSIPVTPTTPGLGLDTVATEAHVDSSVFGATPTYRQGDDIAVQPASHPDLALSPGFESPNTSAVSCEPTQLSARDVKLLDSIPRAPQSAESEPRAISTNRRPRRGEALRGPQEITLASAGVEPVTDGDFGTPAPSEPEVFVQVITVEQDFGECHDGQTQSAPKYNETLVGLAPVARESAAPESPNSVAELKSSEYVLTESSALPPELFTIAESQDAPPADESVEVVEELPSEFLQTEPPSHVVAVAEEAVPHEAAPHEAAPQDVAPQEVNEEPSPAQFQALDVPSDEPGRVDELLQTFGRPEEGEDAMLRKTASSLKELAGLDATPCVPSVSPAIRVPIMTNRASPAWLPEDPRQAEALDPAPLVKASRGWRDKLRVPLALFIALFAGFAVVHWRLPEVVLRWVRPVATQPQAAPPQQAAAEQEVYVEP